MTGSDAGRRSEVVALLRFRKNIRHIVSLVAPGIHVHRRKENAKRRVQHDPVTRHVVRKAESGGELEFVRVG